MESDYHRRQAETLIRLAKTTRDPETSAALMQLAAQHVALAEKAGAASIELPPDNAG